MVTAKFSRYKFSLTGRRLLFSNRIFMLELVCRASAQSSATFRSTTITEFCVSLKIDNRRPEDEQWSGPRREAEDTFRLELGIASSKVRSFRWYQHYAAGLVTLNREHLFLYWLKVYKTSDCQQQSAVRSSRVRQPHNNVGIVSPKQLFGKLKRAGGDFGKTYRTLEQAFA